MKISIRAMQQPLCLYPFSHICQRGDSVSAPCCKYLLNSQEKDELPRFSNAIEAFHSSTWDELRQKMRGPTLPEGCFECANDEKNSGSSMRILGFERFKNLSTNVIHELELFVGNKCNFKCRMCGPSLSSKWATDAKALGIYSVKYDFMDVERPSMNDPRLAQLKTLRILGGEPTLGNYLRDTLTELDKIGRLREINLEFSTNCSLIPSAEVIDLLLKARAVNISLSIDAVGKLAEYARKGCDWETTQRVVQFWGKLSLKHKNILPFIQCVVSGYNILRIHELFIYINELEFNLPLRICAVTNPSELAPARIPLTLRLQYKDWLKKDFPLFMDCDWADHIAKNHILSQLEAAELEIYPFAEYSAKLDELRSENIFSVLPEYKNFMPTIPVVDFLNENRDMAQFT